MKTKISATVVTSIKTVKINNIKTSTPSNVKFTKEETYYAMKLSARIRKLAAQRLNCKYHDVSNKECLDEAYRRITRLKLIKSGIMTVENKNAIKSIVKKEFGYNNVNTMVVKANLDEIKPKSLIQAAILNIAKLEKMTRDENGKAW